ncbi:hypothetical protein pipiens_020140, partial [Culex pipiens pipiens]
HVERKAQPVRDLHAVHHVRGPVHRHLHRAAELDLAGRPRRVGRGRVHLRVRVLAHDEPAVQCRRPWRSVAQDSGRNSAAA